MAWRLLKCICEHELQDRQYGSGKRLHTPVAKAANGWRCTVCGREQTVSGKVDERKGVKRQARRQ